MAKLHPTPEHVTDKMRCAAIEMLDMPLKTIEDYKAYNREARKNGRPVKIPPAELHKQLKIKFDRIDQPQNVLKFIVVNADIDWKGELIPGRIYTLPEPVVRHLDSRAVPIFEEVKVNEDGYIKTETRQVGESSRFHCRLLEQV